MTRTGIMAMTTVLAAALVGSGCDEKVASKPAAPVASPSTHAAAAPEVRAKASAAVPTTRVITEEVRYTAGKTMMKGYVAYPAGGKKVPGVLVVHEWWGLNEYARTRAEMLAKEGYAALAVDMYGDGKTADNPGDAKKLSGEVFGNLDAAVERFKAAKKVLEDHPVTDPGKVAAIGYCFGGGVVLHMARSGVDLDAVASFHGVLATKTPAAKGSFRGKMLVAHGAADPMVPPEQVEAFKKEMSAAGVELRFRAYPGAKHAFSNPAATETGEKFDLPVAYDERADKASWKELLALFSEVFPRE